MNLKEEIAAHKDVLIKALHYIVQSTLAWIIIGAYLAMLHWTYF